MAPSDGWPVVDAPYLVAGCERPDRLARRSRLDEPLYMVRGVDPDPETVTARRREINEWLAAEFGAPPRGPGKYELDFYAKVGRTPPVD